MKKLLYFFLFFCAFMLCKREAYAQFAAVYDLRTLGYVSPVKDQGSCGSCWAFATIAAIESNWLKQGYGLSVLSEDNIIDCHGFDEAPCAGGSYYMSSALLSRHDGPLNLSDDAYTPSTGNCPLSFPFPPQKPALVEEIRWIPPVRNEIKQAIMDYGAVASAMFFTMANYSIAKYKYYDAVIDAADSLNAHCVAIAGWNDTMAFAGAPGNGGWIIKDSYGTSWAQNGYFYISYYDAGILSDNAVFPNRIEIPVTSNILNLYSYDKFGWVDNYGYGNNVGYGLVKYVLAPVSGIVSSQQIKRVGTYVVDNGTTLDIELYRTKSGNNLSNLIAAASLFCEYKGFYTIPFELPTDSLGSEIYIRVKYTCSMGTTLPVPIETYEAGHTSAISLSANSCWVSPDGQNWNLAGQGTSNNFDVCVKLYTENAPTAKMSPLPDSVCMGSMINLMDLTPAPRDSIRWLVNGSYYGSWATSPVICNTAGPMQIALVAFLGYNNDTVSSMVYVAGTDTSLMVTNSTLTSGASGVSWQWLDCSNGFQPISGETFQSYTPLVDGDYAVEVRNWECADTSRCISIINAGIDKEFLNSSGAFVAPNPSDGRLVLTLPDNSTVIIYDHSGRKVYCDLLPIGPSGLDLRNLAEGLYCIRIIASGHVNTLKFLISR